MARIPEQTVQTIAAVKVIIDLDNRVQVLETLLGMLKRGGPDGCWCDVAIGNPMMEGKHSSLCQAVQRELQG